MTTIQAASLDERLRHTGSSVEGTVRSVNSKVIYLTGSNDLFIAVFPSLVGNGPHYVLVNAYDELAALLAAGQPFVWSGKALEFPDGVELDCAVATGWQPALMTGVDKNWKHHVQLAYQYLYLVGHHQAQDVLHVPQENFIMAAGLQDWGSLEQAIVSLVGLGPGLTPAGDDFLAGFFGAYAQLSLVCPGLRGFFEKSSGLLSAHLPGRTHPVAAFFTSQFITGYPSQIFQEVLFSICGEEGGSGLLESVLRLIGFGATSGTELLRGLLSAMDTAARQSWI